MLDHNRLKLFIKKHTRLLLLVGGFLVAILLYFLAAASIEKPFLPPSLIPRTTPTPSPFTPTIYSPPLTIDLSQAETDVRETTVTTYTIPQTATINLNLDKIRPRFSLPSDPETITTQYIQIQTWAGPNYYLSHNLLAHQINLGLNDETKINKTGTFQTEANLIQNAISLVNSLAVFAQQINFKSERVNYLVVGEEWQELSNPSDAHLIEIILTPQIGNLPLYQQELPFISTIYDRNNKLVKLTITNPIPAFEKFETQTIASLAELRNRQPENFFRLFVKPKTDQEFFLSAPDIKDLSPNRLSLGLYLENGILFPIYLLATDNYLYATSALATLTPTP